MEKKLKVIGKHDGNKTLKEPLTLAISLSKNLTHSDETQPKFFVLKPTTTATTLIYTNSRS